jgi:hypothetical protein
MLVSPPILLYPLHVLIGIEVYPFFRFTPTPDDPYTFPLTFTASCAIWVSPPTKYRPDFNGARIQLNTRGPNYFPHSSLGRL